MKLIEYLPEFLQNIKEFKELFNSEDKEIEKLNEEIQRITKEVIVDTAENYGLLRYEKIFNITNISSDIEERRFNIKNKILNQYPYTMRWLENKLENLVGKGNYKIILEDNILKIEVFYLFKNIATSLKVQLREEIPANLLLDITLMQTEFVNIHFAGVVYAYDDVIVKEVI